MSDLIGQQLGNYHLTARLGQGGFADVYLGEHVHLNVPAAIKVLRTQLTEDDVKNFRIEARTIAHLAHPNIVQVLDFGVENALPFLVMAYAPNSTLRHRHRRGQMLSANTIISYVRQVASALQYAHDQKIIHRDIKPENMLIGRNDEILLSDFGIALPTASAREQGRLVHSALPNQSTWDPVGTVTYMAPEQIQGKPSPASDQYALGVVVYEWICGYAPFNGTYVEIAMQKISTTASSLLSRVPDLSPEVEKVVLTALATDPLNRFRNVQAFAAALQQAYYPPASPVISSEPVVALIGPTGRIQVKGETIAIGRKSTNHVVLANDPKVSSLHAELRPFGKDYCIVDLESTNGTTVNGEKLVPHTPRVLKTGNVLLIGDSTFTYEISGSTQAEASSDGATVRSQEPAAPGAMQNQSPSGNQPAQPGYTPNMTPPAPPVQPGYTPNMIPSGLPAPPAQPGYTPNMTPPAQPGYTPNITPSGLPAQPGYTPNMTPSGLPAQPGYTPNMTPSVQPGFSQTGIMSGIPGGFRPLNPTVPVLSTGPSSQPGFTPVLTPRLPGTPTRSSRKRLWRISAIILVVLLVGGSIIGIVISRIPTPAQTLSAFCAALLGKDNATAWSQLSSTMQNEVTSQNIFNSFFSGTKTCTPGTPAQNNTTATATLALVSPARSATDNITLMKQSDGIWRIDNESGISGLVQMLTAYCSALKQGNYSTAYNQFSGTFQSELTEPQFVLDFTPNASSCLYSSLTMTAGGAQIAITETNTSGALDNTGASLVETNSSWKIDDFTNLPEKVLQSFCTDLKSGNYQSAYNLGSSTFQTGVGGLANFSKTSSNFTSCSPTAIQQINNNLASEMIFALKKGGTTPYVGTLVLDKSTGEWEIDNLLNFALIAVEDFCTNLEQHDFTSAYQELTPDTRAQYTEAQFAQVFANLIQCVVQSSPQLLNNNTEATAPVQLTNADNSSNAETATLVRQQPENWLIRSLN